VEKAAIMDAAWPGLVVEESNLAAQISAIRRALSRTKGGEDWIETLARRGYRYVGPVVEIAGETVRSASPGRERTNLPQVLNAFIGRDRRHVLNLEPNRLVRVDVPVQAPQLAWRRKTVPSESVRPRGGIQLAPEL